MISVKIMASNTNTVIFTAAVWVMVIIARTGTGTVMARVGSRLKLGSALYDTLGGVRFTILQASFAWGEVQIPHAH